MKKQNGITLIALIITIIVLLILAGITINLTIGERGIITRAQKAGKNYVNAQQQEEGLLDNLENEMDNIIKDLTSGENQQDIRPTAKNTLQVGDYVKYNTGVTSVGTNGVVTFRVLYNDEVNGLQIISNKNIGDVTLGGNDWTAAITSYNNAIEILNSKADDYIGALGQDGRCVGSVPTVENGIFTAKNTEVLQTYSIPDSWTLPTGWTSRDTGCRKWIDTNYTANGNTSITRDIEAMKQGNIDLMTTGEFYWLASRDAGASSSNCGFYVRCIFTDGSVSGYTICTAYSDGDAIAYTPGFGLRPCISLKSGLRIIAGDGKSEATAYELGF